MNYLNEAIAAQAESRRLSISALYWSLDDRARAVFDAARAAFPTRDVKGAAAAIIDDVKRFAVDDEAAATPANNYAERENQRIFSGFPAIFKRRVAAYILNSREGDKSPFSLFLNAVVEEVRFSIRNYNIGAPTFRVDFNAYNEAFTTDLTAVSRRKYVSSILNDLRNGTLSKASDIRARLKNTTFLASLTNEERGFVLHLIRSGKFYDDAGSRVERICKQIYRR